MAIFRVVCPGKSVRVCHNYHGRGRSTRVCEPKGRAVIPETRSRARAPACCPIAQPICGLNSSPKQNRPPAQRQREGQSARRGVEVQHSDDRVGFLRMIFTRTWPARACPRCAVRARGGAPLRPAAVASGTSHLVGDWSLHVDAVVRRIDLVDIKGARRNRLHRLDGHVRRGTVRSLAQEQRGGELGGRHLGAAREAVLQVDRLGDRLAREGRVLRSRRRARVDGERGRDRARAVREHEDALALERGALRRRCGQSGRARRRAAARWRAIVTGGVAHARGVRGGARGGAHDVVHERDEVHPERARVAVANLL